MKIEQSEMRLAEGIAKRASFKWSAVEREDLASHLYLWLAEHQGALENYRRQPGGEGALYVALSREARNYCVKEQQHRNGALLDDDNYSQEEIKTALPLIFDQSNRPLSSVAVHPHYGNAIEDIQDASLVTAVLADVSRCFSMLDKEQKAVLAMRYRDDLSAREIAEVLKVKRMTVYNRLNRAIKALQNKLNGF